jgi:hypothetical protein
MKNSDQQTEKHLQEDDDKIRWAENFTGGAVEERSEEGLVAWCDGRPCPYCNDLGEESSIGAVKRWRGRERSGDRERSGWRRMAAAVRGRATSD